jgi:hypothetical protein
MVNLTTVDAAIVKKINASKAKVGYHSSTGP